MLRDIAHGGAKMSQRNIFTGVAVGLLIGLMGDVLLAKTGVKI